MQRSGLRSLGGAALGMGLLAQEPPGGTLGIPIWVWILLFVLVIAVAIIWVLREEDQEAAPDKAEGEALPEAEAAAEVEAVEEPAPAETEAGAAAAGAVAVEAVAEEVEVVEEPTPEPEAEAAEVAAADTAAEESVAPAEPVVGPAAAAGVAGAAAAAAVAVAGEDEAIEEPAPEPEAEVPTRAAAAAAVAAGLEAAEEPAEADDLQRIEGVGPKIAGLLQDAGITSFAQLADTDVGRLQGILDEAGISQIADPSSWPEQARLAAAGNWAALEALQDRLKGGRQVKPDNFQRIEGIGPKIARLLVSAGITSFAQLADADVGRLQGILDEAGISRIAVPDTWPEQARLAADGDWTGLEALQDQLKGGRRAEA